MSEEKRRRRARVKPLRLFFYNGDLCRKIHIHRPNDIVIAWNYRKGKSEPYQYSDVRKRGEQAYSTRQVGEMLGKSPRILKRHINLGNFEAPQMTYGVDENRNAYGYYWSEKDIFNAYEFFKTVHIGRPRKDGLVTPSAMPTASELRAMIRQGTVFYVKEGDKFVPTWHANNL